MYPRVILYNFCIFVEFLNISLSDVIIYDAFIALRSKGIIQNPLPIAKFLSEQVRIERRWSIPSYFLLHLRAEIPGTA
mgnify:CR=1 FL=1